MKYELIESPTEPGHWHVEAFTEEGECVKAVFSGPGARMRAWRYCGYEESFQQLEIASERMPAGFYEIPLGADYKTLTGRK